jgi:hypothetical protein
VHKPLVTLITSANATSLRVSKFNPALQHQIIVNGNIPVIDPLTADQSDQVMLKEIVNAQNFLNLCICRVSLLKLEVQNKITFFFLHFFSFIVLSN